jgi:ketosteroid isomerase-like protein
VEADEREDFVRRSLRAWNESDWEGLRSMWIADGEIVAPEAWPESGTFLGWPAIEQQFRRLKDSWAEERTETVSIESTGEAVLTHTRWVVRGEASGAPLEVEIWVLCEFEGELISKATYFMDAEAARAAAERAA